MGQRAFQAEGLALCRRKREADCKWSPPTGRVVGEESGEIGRATSGRV